MAPTIVMPGTCTCRDHPLTTTPEHLCVTCGRTLPYLTVDAA